MVGQTYGVGSVSKLNIADHNIGRSYPLHYQIISLVVQIKLEDKGAYQEQGQDNANEEKQKHHNGAAKEPSAATQATALSPEVALMLMSPSFDRA